MVLPVLDTETERQSSGLGGKNLIKHQLLQADLYFLGVPCLSYPEFPCNLYLFLDFEYFCLVANY